MYDPTTARWTSPDPIGFEQSQTNLYQYVSSRPTILEDPSGLGSPNSFTLCSKPVKKRGGTKFFPGIEICYTSDGTCEASGGSVKLVQAVQWYGESWWSGSYETPWHFDCIDPAPLPPGTVWPGYGQCGGQGSSQGKDTCILDRPGWGGWNTGGQYFNAIVCAVCVQPRCEVILGCVRYDYDPKNDTFQVSGRGPNLVGGCTTNVPVEPPNSQWRDAERRWRLE